MINLLRSFLQINLHFSFSYFQGIELIFRLSLALLENHQDELMLLSMEEMLKVTFSNVMICQLKTNEEL